MYTGEMLSAQARKIKDKILKLHVDDKLQKKLTDQELTALNAFTASSSWASKKALDLGLKSVRLHGEAADVFAKEERRAEVVAAFDEALVDESEIVADEDGKVDSEDEDSDVEMVKEQEAVTAETIDEMCRQLIQIAVKVKNFKCDGDEFDGVAGKITDLSSSLRLSHKRMLNNKIARKQQKEPRQQGLLPFFRARGDGS